MTKILQLIAGLVLLLFAGLWIWMGFAILKFTPTDADPVRDFTTAQITVAGFLSSAVAAGTASVLGIQIQKASGRRWSPRSAKPRARASCSSPALRSMPSSACSC